VITIQPEFWPLDLLSKTLATTPSPKTIRVIVPNISARNIVKPPEKKFENQTPERELEQRDCKFVGLLSGFK
jgi:hypothetical protein